MTRRLAALLTLVVLTGCGALGAVSDATADLDAYTLQPVAADGEPALGTDHLVVELPTSAGALATDRILIKPLPFQAQYLPDGRWTEPAPGLVQTLLVASFQNLGGFRLVGRDGAGLLPEYTLMTELQEFQAEPTGPATAPLVVKVSVMLTLIRESDLAIIGAQRFSAMATVVTDDTPSIVAGFDAALRTVLQEAVGWTLAQAG